MRLRPNSAFSTWKENMFSLHNGIVHGGLSDWKGRIISKWHKALGMEHTSIEGSHYDIDTRKEDIMTKHTHR